MTVKNVQTYTFMAWTDTTLPFTDFTQMVLIGS